MWIISVWDSSNPMVISIHHQRKLTPFEAQVGLIEFISKCLYFLAIQDTKYPRQTPLKGWGFNNKKIVNCYSD